MNILPGQPMTRRTMLAGSSAAMVMASTHSFAAPQRLRAAPSTFPIVQDAPDTAVWAYDSRIPGPELRLTQGQRLTRMFENALPQASTIHWHGIRIDNAMDGVPKLTQDAVAPGETFQYDFEVPDAGTYWYHPHNRTWEQMARGLSGPLIVEERDPPEVDHDIPLLIDDWRLEKDGSSVADFGSMRDWSHAGRLGNFVTVNGATEFRKPVRARDRLGLRLINTPNARIYRGGLQGLKGWVVAFDGQPLEQLQPAGEFLLAPAQRMDLIVDVEDGVEEGVIYEIERGNRYVLASFPLEGGRRNVALPTLEPLAPNPVPSAKGYEPDITADLVMSGGAMGQMTHAILKGQKKPIRELVRDGMAWSFNGIAGMAETPLIEARTGQVIRMKIVNDTQWPHAIHLHGHHFQERHSNEVAGPFRDTIYFDRNQTREIMFVADNPGKWMLHCHMLEHAAAGMMAWIDVQA